MNAYVYPTNPVNGVDPLGLETCVITTRGKTLGIGDHSALYISRGYSNPENRKAGKGQVGGPVLYDPAGSYFRGVVEKLEKNNAVNRSLIGELNANHYVIGKSADLGKFKAHHNADDVTMACKDTTEEEEKEFFGNILEESAASAGGCALSVSNVIMGSDAFPRVKSSYMLPGNLERAARKNKADE
jgi:hypothetical protein